MRFLVLICILGLAAWHGTAQAACTVAQRASVPFTLMRGRLTVPLVVNGIPATFVLDTGAQRALVTPQAVRRLDLALDQWVATTMRGVGGIVEHPDADPRSMTLGGMTLRQATLARDMSLTVGDLPGMGADMAVDGLLGRDFLSMFDLEFDMVARRLTLYDVRECSGRFLPWTSRYQAVAAAAPMQHAMVLPIALNGVRLTALLDTGASSSLVTLPGMIRLGLTQQALAGDPAATVRGIGRQAPAMHQHRFASLQVGGETIPQPLVWVAPVRVVPIVDALLGADWLDAQRRVWISFATSQVFFEGK
ncbi:MAG TPA: retropepsin-like aspartic protease [Acetobacteraceae bacterium]|jgi:predicted aspartyl protease|nr:retropepsin-like aspartic protease [Acetobacteraceae bacterium]